MDSGDDLNRHLGHRCDALGGLPQIRPRQNRVPGHHLRTGRAVDPEQLTIEGRDTGELLIDAIGQSRNIIVSRTHDDAFVRRHSQVKSDKVSTIKRQDRSTRIRREC